MHAIQKRPVAINDKVEIRPMMYVALSYDHRLVDGARVGELPGAGEGIPGRPGAVDAGDLTLHRRRPDLTVAAV